jgi:hypothetical protein
MFILGHSGISVGAVRALDRRASVRWVPFFGLLPDLVDKPIELLAPVWANGWSRTVAHSLLGLAVFSLGAALVARRRAWIAIVPYALHFVLDRMWYEQDRPVLLWPFIGFDLPRHAPPYLHWWDRFQEPWQLGGELVGLSILLLVALNSNVGGERPRAEDVPVPLPVPLPEGTVGNGNEQSRGA